MGEYENLRAERGDVSVFTINRPKALSVLKRRTLDALTHVVEYVSGLLRNSPLRPVL